MTKPSSITERAMLVNLSISYWTGKASDDSVTDELTKSHETDRDVHDYRKRLVKAEAIGKFKAVRSRARAYHFDKTSPWIDGGTRILAAPLYFDYTKAMHEFKAEYETQVQQFLANYGKLKGEARKRLGTLFKDADYPTPEGLRRKFGWEMRVWAIPTGDDWRVDLGDKSAAEMQKQIEAQVKEAMALATKDLWKRLHVVVEALALKMKDADPTFRDSIIGNIKELVGLLPLMNVTDDPKLEAMRKKVEVELSSLNPDELREDPKARKKTADAADAILKTMAGYIGVKP
jgi:hypothetical protein